MTVQCACKNVTIDSPLSEVESSDLIGEIKALRDAVDELQILLQHIWQNREELHLVLKDVTESPRITCSSCDDDAPSLAAAIEDGWQELTKGDDRFYGMCSSCLAGEDAAVEETRRPVSKSPGTLF